MTAVSNKGFDPRVFFVYSVCMTGLAVLCNRMEYLAVLLLISIAAAVGAKRAAGGTRSLLPWKQLRILLWTVVILSLLQSIFNPSGRVLFSLGNVKIITAGGILLGVMFFCRILIILFAAVALASRQSRWVIQGLIQWKMPYEIAFMTVIALRYIPIFGEEIRHSLIAIQLRGVDLKHVPMKKRLRVYTYLFMPLVSGMVIRAKEMALAMEMRGFRVYDKRTSYIELHLKGKDYALMLLTAAMTAVVLVCYYRGVTVFPYS